jgi:hypothetical protein
VIESWWLVTYCYDGKIRTGSGIGGRKHIKR